MEHLSLPTQRATISIKVPCLIGDTCDDGPFESYLERRNLTEEQIISCQRNGEAPDSLLRHLQIWLFFGILQELATIVDAPVAIEPPLPQAFVTKDVNSRIISTRNLRSFWTQIELELNARTNDEQNSYRQKLIRSIRRSNLLISKLQHSEFMPQYQAVILSIMLLNEFIMEAADLYELEDQRPYFRSHLLESIMQQKGWCPSDTDRLRLDLDITTLLFTLHCGAPPCRKMHDECTSMLCCARQILDSEEYHSKHIPSPLCDCKYLFADREISLDSLGQGTIPVSILDTRSHPLVLRTLNSSQASKYVAISHVWSDLMGNRTANSLPQCTLRSLQGRVNDLYGLGESDVAFWIDTLSCPVEPESATEQAIALMRETYANADKVLVLDSYLESVNSQGMTGFEKALRIVCTGWTRRLWTLQEGVLAKQIFFQFADGAIDGDEVFTSLAQPPISYAVIPIFHSWLEIRQNWNDIFDSLNKNAEFVWMLYRALRFRTTSVATDEPLCLSALTGVELKEILMEKRDNRMRRFWELIPNVDTSLLYWTGPRLDVQGMRWAPASLLGASPEAILASSAKQIREAKEAVRTPNGIVFNSPGVLLGSWKTSVNKSFWLKYSEDEWFHVSLIRDVGQPVVRTTETEATSHFKELHGYSSSSQVLALLTHDSLLQCFDDADFHIGEQPPSCALISIYGTNDKLFFASVESVGVIRPFNVDQLPPTSRWSIPALANALEHELRPPATELRQGTAGPKEDMGTDHNRESIFDMEAQPSKHEEVRLVDRPDIQVTFEDDRMNLVVSGCHRMFHGAGIPSTQRFCVG